MDNGLTVEVVKVGQDPLLEFGFRSHPNASQDRARHLREEAFDKIKPGAVFWSEDESKAAVALSGEPVVGFLGHVRRMIVQDDLDRCVGRVGSIELFEEADEFA